MSSCLFSFSFIGHMFQDLPYLNDCFKLSRYVSLVYNQYSPLQRKKENIARLQLFRHFGHFIGRHMVLFLQASEISFDQFLYILCS